MGVCADILSASAKYVMKAQRFLQESKGNLVLYWASSSSAQTELAPVQQLQVLTFSVSLQEVSETLSFMLSVREPESEVSICQVPNECE